jgi:N-acetylmuramoyl-L-alanine amidase
MMAKTRKVLPRRNTVGAPLNIDKNSYPAYNLDARISTVVIHRMHLPFKTSMAILTAQGAHSPEIGAVSTHYVIADPTEKTYLEAGHAGGLIFQLVDEQERAWHAGISSWNNRDGLNDTAVGIELINFSTAEPEQEFPPYPAAQIQALMVLLHHIKGRYSIDPKNIVGHSDIAPTRKDDPGPAFPWKQLAEAGLAAWYDEATKQTYFEKFSTAMPSQQDMLNQLQRYGYGVLTIATDEDYKKLISAFQMHFRPSCYNGAVDAQTAAILYALVKKYNSVDKEAQPNNGGCG